MNLRQGYNMEQANNNAVLSNSAIYTAIKQQLQNGRRCLLWGAPCSGKTSIAKQFINGDFVVFHTDSMDTNQNPCDTSCIIEGIDALRYYKKGDVVFYFPLSKLELIVRYAIHRPDKKAYYAWKLWGSRIDAYENLIADIDEQYRCMVDIEPFDPTGLCHDNYGAFVSKMAARITPSRAAQLLDGSVRAAILEYDKRENTPPSKEIQYGTLLEYLLNKEILQRGGTHSGGHIVDVEVSIFDEELHLSSATKKDGSMPSNPRQTAAYKESVSRFYEENRGKIILTADDNDLITQQVDFTLSRLTEDFDIRNIEMQVAIDADICGIKFYGIIDYLIRNGVPKIIDLKRTDMDRIGLLVRNMGYDFKMWLYQRILEHSTGENYDLHLLIATPYGVANKQVYLDENRELSFFKAISKAIKLVVDPKKMTNPIHQYE